MVEKSSQYEDIDIDSSESSPHSEEINSDIKPKSSFNHVIDIIFKGDKVIWLVFIILCVISLVEIFSATSTLVYRSGNHWGPIFKHSMFLITGFGLILLMHNVPYKYYSSLIFLLFISIVLLIITPFVGQTINESERWLELFGLTIQPSEFAKLSLMGTMAFLLSKHKGEYEGLYFKWMVGLMVLVTGIIAAQNLSTGLLLFLVCFLMMFIGGVKISRLLKLVSVCVAFAALAIFLLKVTPTEWIEKVPLKRLPTWQNRIAEFGNSKQEEEGEKTYVVTDENYQVAFSKIAIANGGLIGQFPGNSQARDFLPQAYSDFIYAIIIEEIGIIGGIFVLLLYIVILIRAGMIARNIDSLFPKYLVLGSAMMLSIQALVNMAVAVNLIPVTGQPLPLISRGGTSTLVTCAYFGLILSADRFSKDKRARKSKNNDDESEVSNVEIEDVVDLDEQKDFKVIKV